MALGERFGWSPSDMLALRWDDVTFFTEALLELDERRARK